MSSVRIAVLAALACSAFALADSLAALPPGISLLKDLYPGIDATRSSGAAEFAALGAEVLFRACDSEHGCELWKTDGTEVGTVLVADLWPGEGSGSPFGFVQSATKAFFRATDGIQGTMLWVTDGTAAGTKLVLHSSQAFYGQAFLILDMGSQVLSGTDDLVAISSSTLAVSVLLPGATPYFAAPLGGTVLFSTWFQNAVSAGNLYRTNGTAVGTSLVTTVPNAVSPPVYLTSAGSRVFFVANTNPGHGRELWISDGTAVGTTEVKDIRSGLASSSPGQLTAVGSTLYFTANDGSNGTELWKSDGTEPGTTIVKDISSGSASSSPSDLVAIGSTLYFFASDAATGRELWKSDGTPGGTVPVLDLVPGAGGSAPTHLVAFGSSVVFYANDGVHGLEPWISDGSEAGTAMIADFNLGSADSVDAGYGFGPRVMGGALYLSIDDGVTGFDPWISDGTAAGSSRIADLAAGTGDGRLPSYESATSGVEDGGRELVSLANWGSSPASIRRPVGSSGAPTARRRGRRCSRTSGLEPRRPLRSG